MVEERVTTPVNVLETDRLLLRWLSADDAEFILGLLNEPSWIQFIGDRGVRTLDDARAYIQNGPVEMYHRLGFGLYLVERKEDGVPLGMCGLIKRKGLDDVDIGFAFRPGFWSKGYAFEAAAAVVQYARSTLGLRRIVAITAPDNESSIKLLQKLGLKFEKRVTLSEDQSEVMLFGSDL
jgi:RimJ/RimL family protein N-acetyltransferase